MRKVFLAASLVLCGGVAAWLFLSNIRAPSLGGASPKFAGADPSNQAAPRLHDPHSPAIHRAETGAPQGLQQVSEELVQAAGSAGPAEGTGNRLRTPSSYFEARYPSLDRAAAVRLAKEVDQEFNRHQQRLFTERLEVGLFEIYPYEYDRNGNRRDFQITMPGLQFAQPFHSPDQSQWHVVFLREDEYPELFRLFDERAWLRKKAHELKREESNR